MSTGNSSPDNFDPYHRWLLIPPAEQPADRYRLLGLSRFEADPSVIESAANQKIAHVRRFQQGPQAEVCTKILKQLVQAKRCLLEPNAKLAYDQALRSVLKKRAAAAGGSQAGQSGVATQASSSDVAKRAAGSDVAKRASGSGVAKRAGSSGLRKAVPMPAAPGKQTPTAPAGPVAAESPIVAVAAPSAKKEFHSRKRKSNNTALKAAVLLGGCLVPTVVILVVWFAWSKGLFSSSPTSRDPAPPSMPVAGNPPGDPIDPWKPHAVAAEEEAASEAASTQETVSLETSEPPTTADGRWPIPSESLVQAARQGMANFLASASLRNMLEISSRRERPEEVYVLLTTVRDRAVEQGEIDMAFAATRDFAERFDVDELQARIQTFDDLVRAAPTPEKLQQIVDRGEPIVVDAMRSGRKESALEAAAVALYAARSLGNRDAIWDTTLLVLDVQHTEVPSRP